MAPSFNVGKPLRSLVRIPGCSQSKSNKVICISISQISSFGFDNGGIPPNFQGLQGSLLQNRTRLVLTSRASFANSERRGIAADNNVASGWKRPAEDGAEDYRKTKKPRSQSEAGALSHTNSVCKSEVKCHGGELQITQSSSNSSEKRALDVESDLSKESSRQPGSLKIAECSKEQPEAGALSHTESACCTEDVSALMKSISKKMEYLEKIKEHHFQLQNENLQLLRKLREKKSFPLKTVV